MLYSKLVNNSVLYISLHAEQVYQNFAWYEPGSDLLDSQLGFFASELKIDTLERIRKDLKIQITESINNVIIDCARISESRNPASELDLILDLIVVQKKISFGLIRVGLKLYEDFKLKKHKLAFGSLVLEVDTPEFTNFFIKSTPFDVTGFDNFIFKIYQENLYQKIKNSYIQKNQKKYSNSSNVYLPKYINIKIFIEEKELNFFGLYLLCKNAITKKIIPDLEDRGKSKKTILFFQSLNGAYLASIISKIALLDMAYIDHIGPVNKIYRTILKNNFDDQNNYVIVSDVICMGTEVEITKSLIQYENSIVKGNLTIVKVEAIKGKKEIPTESLFILSKANNTELKYKIRTEFK